VQTKVAVIRRNADRYSISAQCKILGISRGSYYYDVKPPKDETELENAVQTAFEENRGVYGRRKLKRVLSKKGINLSKEKICRIMSRRGLKSAYTRQKYKSHSKKCNEAAIPNLLDRQFNGQERLAAVVSDLTYVRVGQKWQYACILLDLHNREI
jgi:transposase InsO family protein